MAASPPLSKSSFDKALENFKSKSGLTSRELLNMEMTNLSDLQKSLAAMQKTQQGSKTMMYLRRLQPFLDAMEQYGNVINIFVNTSNLVGFIWGPMKFLLIIASNFSDAFNALLEGYLSIGDHIPLLVQYRQLFETNQYMQTALASIFEDVLEFHLEAVKLFRQRTWRKLYHATGRSLTKKIEEIAKSLQRHKSIIDAQVTLIEYEEFQASHTYMKAEFAKLQSSEQDRRYTRVQDWLGSTIDSRSRHQDAGKDRFGNTGQWLLQDQRFKNWFAPNQCIDPLLWLHGIPGAGKTVLASLVVEEVSKVPGAMSLCFYCKHTDEQKNGFLAVAKSMISQILPKNDSILDYLYEEASKSGDATLSTTALARELFEVALKSCRMCYVVLDGLDEYSRDDRKELASWFQQLISGLPRADFGSVRCLFVSQEDGFARKDLSMLSQIKITPTENKADIESFCKEWHQKIELKFGALEKREHHVTNVISARAQGMFLYAKLVTWNLHEQTSRADFEVEMDPERVPDGLDQAYDRIIERLVGPAAPLSRRNNVRKLLGWLACARRPLKWYEIQGAVTVDLDNGMISAKHQFREDCKDLCASLVEITSDQTVTLVHSTTKQYLVRNSFIQVPDVECDLAILCLVYLSMAEFEIDKSESEIEEAYLRGVYAFADYAVCFWVLHIEAALSECGKQGSNRVELISECLEAFLDMHWVDTTKTEVVSNTLQERLALLQQHHCYQRACQAVAAAKSWLRPSGKGPSDDNVLQLPRAISHIRTIIEHLISSSSIPSDTEMFILQHYGSNHYKCARMNCQFFHRGFTSGTQRDQHIAKHDRSFACVWEGCPYEIIGFATSKDLQKHVSDHHGIKTEPDELEFPESERSTVRPNLKHPATFQCNLCPKRFTRAYNLRSHLRTHTDERPFVCTVCGKAFSRPHDRRRHEGLHSGEKKFVCRGELQRGGQWGCGRRFARADALGLHFRSEAGRVCINPLEVEASIKRQREADQNSMDQATQDPFSLPEELLAQYPALQNLDWEPNSDLSQLNNFPSPSTLETFFDSDQEK